MSNAKITNKMQKKICTLIIAWQGKLSWEKLVLAIRNDLSFVITRQTLHDYVAIKNEFDNKKRELRGLPYVSRKVVSADKEELIQKIDKLDAALVLAEETTSTQLAFIEDIIENAKSMSVDMQKLLVRRSRK